MLTSVKRLWVQPRSERHAGFSGTKNPQPWKCRRLSGSGSGLFSCETVCLHFSRKTPHPQTAHPLCQATEDSMPQLELCLSWNSLTSLRKKLLSTQTSLQLCLSDWTKQLHFYKELINNIIILWSLSCRSPSNLLESTQSQAKLSSSCTTAFCFTVFFKEKQWHSQFQNTSCSWGSLKRPVPRVFPSPLLSEIYPTHCPGFQFPLCSDETLVW